MNPPLFILLLLVLFGGGGFYLGGPAIGGGGLVLFLLVCIVIYSTGGFRKKSWPNSAMTECQTLRLLFHCQEGCQMVVACTLLSMTPVAIA